MKKTCFNCVHFHGCLAEEDPSQYHIHNYCEKFNMVLPHDLESEVNRFLESNWKTMCKASIDCDYGVNDDFETGEAGCWMFDEASKPFWSDEKFEENKKHNIELAIKTLEYMFEKGEVIDDYEGDIYLLDDYYNEDEQKYFRDLLIKLKEENK